MGELGSYLTQCRLAEAYLRTMWHLGSSSRLATIHMGRKVVAAVLLLALRGAGSPSNTVAWAEAYLRTKWRLDLSSRLATIDMGQKWGAAVPPFLEGSWVPI